MTGGRALAAESALPENLLTTYHTTFVSLRNPLPFQAAFDDLPTNSKPKIGNDPAAAFDSLRD